MWHASALIHHMKQHAVKQCKEQQKAYAECVRGRTVSVVRVRLGGGVATKVAIDRERATSEQVWSCRASAAAMSECLRCVGACAVRNAMI